MAKNEDDETEETLEFTREDSILANTFAATFAALAAKLPEDADAKQVVRVATRAADWAEVAHDTMLRKVFGLEEEDEDSEEEEEDDEDEDDEDSEDEDEDSEEETPPRRRRK